MCQALIAAVPYAAGRYGDARIMSKSAKRACVGSQLDSGFPDPDLIDHCPAVHAFLTFPTCRSQVRCCISRRHRRRIPVVLLFRQHGSDATRHLVGQRDCHRGFFNIKRASQEPSGARLRDAHRTTAMAPMMSNRRISRWPIFDTFPSRCLPPLDFCRGTSPSQAAKSRPNLKTSIGGVKVSMARAAIGPTPGMVCKRRDVAACLDSVSIVFFNAASRLLN